MTYTFRQVLQIKTNINEMLYGLGNTLVTYIGLHMGLFKSCRIRREL